MDENFSWVAQANKEAAYSYAKVEDAAHLDEEQIRSLVKLMPMALFTCDSEGLITYYNARAAELWGRHPKLKDPEDRYCGSFRIYRPDGSILPHDQCPMAVAVLTGQGVRSKEIHILRPDGTSVLASVNIDPLYDQAGRRIGAINVLEDITRRKQAEERLTVIHQISEAVNRAEEIEQIYELALAGLEQVLQADRTAILLFDESGVMRFQAVRRLSAEYCEQVDGHSPWQAGESDPRPVLVHDVAEADELDTLRHVILAEGIRAMAFIPLIEQGKLLGKFMLYYNQPHFFSDEEVQWAQTIARHVAHTLQRKQAYAQVQNYAHTLEALNQIQISLAAELDLQNQVQMVTDLSTELSGAQFGAFFYNVNDENGKAYMLYTLSGVPKEAFNHVPMPRATALFGATFRGEGPIRMEDVTQDPRFGQNAPYYGFPPGHLPVRSYLAVPVVARGGEVIGGLFFGHEQPGIFTEEAEQLVCGIAAQAAVTIENARFYAQIKENETALRELNATLEQRVEERTAQLKYINHELDQFAYVASHDLKAPLRAISQLAAWISEDAGEALPDSSQTYLTKLHGRVRRMEVLLDDLLAYSRAGRQFHRPEPVDIAALTQNVVEMLSPPSGFVVHIPTGLPLLTMERVPLEVVLRNLLGNAIKHHVHPAEGCVEIDVQDQAQFVEFMIRDNGPGIAPEYHQRIFEMFQTLQPRDQVEGSGMGLALVKKLVESRGGEIRVESSIGKGTAFYFTWPKEVA